MKKIQLNRQQQKGMTTLIVSIALLIITTMGVIFSANVGVMEKKIATNDLRASQAMLSAQAGIDIALANISKYGLSSPISPYTMNGNYFVTNGDQAISYDDGSTTIVTGYYNISIDTTATDYPEKITIVSEGKSDDLTASAKISQTIIFASSIREPSTNAYLNTAVLIVNGTADINENNISNVDGSNLTNIKVWASGTINGGADLTAGLYPNSTYVSDVVPLNYLFINNMRDPMNTGSNTDEGIKQISIRSQCSSSCTNPTTLITNPNSKMHYLEGNVTISGKTLGTSTSPVIIVVDNTDGSSFTLKNSTIYGLLLIKGDWDNSNQTATINGNVVLDEGNLTNGQNISINYSKSVDDNMNQVGTFARIPGGWNDIN